MRTRTLGMALALGLSLLGSSADAATISVVNLNGGSFIQSGSVTNDAASTANIVGFVYSLGTPGDGIATWDSNGGGATGGGTTSDFLTNPNFFQTVTWSGLSVAPGATFNFSGLDIDLILTLVPLNVTGAILDTTGSSLVNAFVRVLWSDGSFGQTSLNQTAWAVSQRLDVNGGTAAVPEPVSLLLFGTGLGAVALRRRRQRARG